MTDTPKLSCTSLRERPDLVPAVAALLNTHWPLNTSMRESSLRVKHDENFPYHVVLLKDDKPIGHACLYTIVAPATGLYVMSVIVAKELRGTGIGRILMQETEKVVMDLGFTSLHLSSRTAAGFYSRIGYQEAAEVTYLGGNAKHLSSAQVSNLEKLFGAKKQPNTKSFTVWMKKILVPTQQ